MNKEKFLESIKQDIRNIEESIALVVQSKNYYVAGELKSLGDYARRIIWEVEDGKYDEK